ncbi:hypothetical protein ABDD95_13090 [Mucilaginibacter sp. PAMB04274]|uniref:hypothetical protein n=1 Tax=Mucilaginibacter sp. PAMB04274 TaxID=3138568 RepID=UPI0031F6F613
MKSNVIKAGALCVVMLLTIVTGCKKDFDPDKPKNGQEVELFLDHYQDVGNQMAYLLPDKIKSPYGLQGFNERELGYTYRVKAKVVITKEPLQDGPDRWFEFERVVSKDLYTGTEPFQVSLISNFVPGGPGLAIGKRDDKYYYLSYEFKPANDAVKARIEEVLALRQRIYTDPAYGHSVSIKATVTHATDNRANTYLVQGIEVK